MTRDRRDAPPLGVPIVDDIAAARARRDADKEARRARHIAKSIAKREADRAAAAATCADETLADNIAATILQNARASLGLPEEREDTPIPPTTRGAA